MKKIPSLCSLKILSGEARHWLKSALFSVRAFDFDSSTEMKEKVNEYRENQLYSPCTAVGELEQISSTIFVNLFSVRNDSSDQGNVTHPPIFGQLEHNFWPYNIH